MSDENDKTTAEEIADAAESEKKGLESAIQTAKKNLPEGQAIEVIGNATRRLEEAKLARAREAIEKANKGDKGR